MVEYTDDFLIETADSANIPRAFDTPYPWHSYPAPNGWHVVVFFDAGQLDYIDHFVAPDGTKVDVWSGVEPPENAALKEWPRKKVE